MNGPLDTLFLVWNEVQDKIMSGKTSQKWNIISQNPAELSTYSEQPIAFTALTSECTKWTDHTCKRGREKFISSTLQKQSHNSVKTKFYSYLDWRRNWRIDDGTRSPADDWFHNTGPLGRQTDKRTTHWVITRMYTMFEVWRRRDLRTPTLLLGKHPSAQKKAKPSALLCKSPACTKCELLSSYLPILNVSFSLRSTDSETVCRRAALFSALEFHRSFNENCVDSLFHGPSMVNSSHLATSHLDFLKLDPPSLKPYLFADRFLQTKLWMSNSLYQFET